jgi:hypothetical protein
MRNNAARRQLEILGVSSLLTLDKFLKSASSADNDATPTLMPLSQKFDACLLLSLRPPDGRPAGVPGGSNVAQNLSKAISRLRTNTLVFPEGRDPFLLWTPAFAGVTGF